MSFVSLALAALALNAPQTAPISTDAAMDIGAQLRAGCHPFASKTPSCDRTRTGKSENMREADAACHPDPTKSVLCNARDRKVEVNAMVLRETEQAAQPL